MNWSSLSEFLDMGGYALYVWGSYLMVFGALVWEVALLVQRHAGARKTVHQYRLIHGDAHDTAP
jgi:heme exporter protein D